MGQYFLCVNPDLHEYIDAHAMACGLKKQEILGSGASVLDGLAMLIADPGIGRKRPADVNMKGYTGRWLGTACFFVGDYAVKGDMSGWRWRVPEEEMSQELLNNGRELGAKMLEKVAAIHGMVPMVRKTTTRYLDGRTEVNRRPELVALFGSNGRTQVDRRDEGMHNREQNAEAQAKVEKMNRRKFLVDAEDGSRRLLANLDVREYVDPRQLAEIPTLAGIMRGHLKRWNNEEQRSYPDEDCPTTLGLMGDMLFNDGKSYDDGEDQASVTGRWRGNRVILTHELSVEYPTTSGIESNAGWRNVTDLLLARMPRPEWGAFHARRDRQRFGRIHP